LFDKGFYSKWLRKCGRSFKAPSTDWKFLGTYNPTIKSTAYHYELYAHGAETYAIFGKDEGATFMGDAEGSPLGYHRIFWSGPEVVDAPGIEALKEAAARSKI
jgi:hypothetical protein